ncbi:MAG TPA: TIGR02444 family protein [Burkholderiales bacterium]|nr:TIGR02444 family protein [Burkholderiales bacterium]
MTQTAPETSRDESRFWRFSLRFYARTKVSAACLALQDEAGVDVNLLLFLLFLAEHQRQVGAGDVAKLDAAVAAWRESVVKPLRALRRALKTGIGEISVTVSETFRGQIKRLELDSEHIEQSVLENFSTANLGTISASRMEAAHANIAAYESHLAPFPAQAKANILSGFAEFGPHHPAN